MIEAIAALAIASLFYWLGSRGHQSQINRLKERVGDHESLTANHLNQAHQEIGQLYNLVKEIDERVEMQQHQELQSISETLKMAGMNVDEDRERTYKPRVGGKL